MRVARAVGVRKSLARKQIEDLARDDRLASMLAYDIARQGGTSCGTDADL